MKYLQHVYQCPHSTVTVRTHIVKGIADKPREQVCAWCDSASVMFLIGWDVVESVAPLSTQEIEAR
ncbi:MAG: hypothetical protein GY896_22795 [Gammaproteobacteria bacterium]|nr:hypothetical protein [Gammaproteobacteria bacterium]